MRAKAALDHFNQSLFALPLVMILAAVAVAIGLLWIDSSAEDLVPEPLQTNAASARVILGTISTGLVAGAALVFSSILVALQLASSQFSPRILRGIIRERRQRATIGIVVATAVYCLVVLLHTAAPGPDPGTEPHLAVVVAVLLAVASLLAIVGDVSHLARSLQVEHQLTKVADETVALIRKHPNRDEAPDSIRTPDGSAHPNDADANTAHPSTAHPVLASTSGWVQQISLSSLCAALPEHGHAVVSTSVGSYVWEATAIAFVWPSEQVDDGLAAKVAGSFYIGPERTMQEDIGFGLVRMTDIALRALSPSLNDENTAVDVIVRAGAVLNELGKRADAPRTHECGNRSVYVPTSPTFADHLRTFTTPLRRSVAEHAGAAAALVSTLDKLTDQLEPSLVTTVREELAAVVTTVLEGHLEAREADRVAILATSLRDESA